MNYISLLQFPFLYCITLVVGLVVFGSDFDSQAGFFYLALIFGIPVFHIIVRKKLASIDKPKVYITINLSGLTAALLVYRHLHFQSWDEHNLYQATLLLFLGICSYLLSIAAAQRIANKPIDEINNISIALIIMAVVWWVSVIYPMSSLFGLACIFIVNLVWKGEYSLLLQSKTDVSQYRSGAIALSKLPMAAVVLSLFLVFMQISWIIWDYQLNTQWAAFLSIILMSTAAMIFVSAKLKVDITYIIVVVIMLNCVLGIVWPDFILNYSYAFIAGICLGWLMLQIFMSNDNKIASTNMKIVGALFFGFVFGYLFAANLEFSLYRLYLTLAVLLVVVVVNFSYKRQGQRAR